MSRRKQTRAIQKFVQKFFQQLWQLSASVTKAMFQWLLRTLLVTRRRQRRTASGAAGFVLPTIVLLLLVVALVIGAILFRAGSRTNQVIFQGQQQVIYNAATPAIDRARAKLEYLFKQDDRRPAGVANEDQLIAMMRNELNPIIGNQVLTPNPYKFPDEEVLEISDTTGQRGLAWTYQVDADGNPQTGSNGRETTVAYSLMLRKELRSGGQSIVDVRSNDLRQKAENLVVRNGPVKTTASQAVCSERTLAPEAGWDEVSSSTLAKSFQVNAVVIANPGNTVNRNVTTLEFQQDREVDRGNRWGAWFRNDLEIFPGGEFRWNGAMHTEGSLIVGNNNVRNFLISSPNSCFYTKSASDISVADTAPNALTGQERFVGQIVAGSVGDNNASGEGIFHLFGPPRIPTNANNTGDNRTKLNSGRDSTNKGVFNLTLDPVALFTRDISRARGGNPDNQDSMDANYQSGTLKGRLFRESAQKPYIDDTYRADNRLGPKPQYVQNRTRVVLNDSNRKNGTEIASAGLTSEELTAMTNNVVPLEDLEYRNLGLDGYWERRARANGMRVIVGPRLELGNSSGWANQDLNANNNRNDLGETDPLYPPNPGQTLSHAQQQRRTWRDNLAAVQATAVYMHNNGGTPNNTGSNTGTGYFPLACVATTAHPGTQVTDANSKRFNLLTGYNYGGQSLTSDFFSGRGTNGWEFEVVPGGGESEAAFAGQIGSGSPLGIALRNLAQFAGDPNGAFPAVQDSNVHPHPLLKMWGDFSNLRRALRRLDTGTPYDNLSIADKSYLHTAACTVGMLAYNVSHYEQYNFNHPQAGTLTAALVQEMDGDNATNDQSGNPDVMSPDGVGFKDGSTDVVRQVLDTSDTTQVDNFKADLGASPSRGGRTYAGEITQRIRNASVEQFISAVFDPNVRQVSELTHNRMQIQRDRVNGFWTPTVTATPPAQHFGPILYNVRFTSGSSPTNPDPNDPFNPLANDYTGTNPETDATKRQIELPCNPVDYGNFGLGSPGNAADERRWMATAIALCPRQPKYPSLYYIFPTAAHNHLGVAASSPLASGSTAEPYLENSYVSNVNTDQYRELTLAQIRDNIALRPKNPGTSNGCNSNDNLCLPTSTTVTLPADQPNTVTAANGTQYRFPFVDSAFYDGREALAVRALSVDLDLLRRSSVGQVYNDTGSLVQETWLPRSGIVYAFREDAVREDAIARPANGTDPANATTIDTPRDPQLETNGISRKPVDFYPDPDRRPYGFRLRNGIDLRKFPGGSVDNDNARGITFITDNPLYIQGNFNLHSTDGTTSNLEEFQSGQHLAANWSNFYTRSNLEPRFARIGSNGDTWRPAELLADSVNILSTRTGTNGFNEGFIELGIKNTDGTMGAHSFRAINRPTNTATWVHEDNSTSNNSTSNALIPIKISRNGHPIVCNAPGITPPAPCPLNTSTNPNNQQEYTGGYQAVGTSHRNEINDANRTEVNSIIVSGIVPSRIQQTYGGFHNFPRMIEDWDGVVQKISGSFIQLNFSTYATGPYEHDAWEPTENPTGASNFEYYWPPNRQWGYDIGLQYAPAGPLSRRLVSTGSPRSEFYRELAVNDPYVCKLRKAVSARDSQLDPLANQECN